MVKAEIFKKDGTKEIWAYTYDALDRRIGKGFLKDGEVSGMSFPHDLSGRCQKTHYFHCDQVGIPREKTDIHGNLLWYGEYTAWGRLKKDERVYNDAALNLDGTIHDKHRRILPFFKDDRDFLFCQGWKT